MGTRLSSPTLWAIISTLIFNLLIVATAQQTDTINDPLYSSQWHLRNTGQIGGTRGEDIDVQSVWQRYKGEGVFISIVDGDLDFTHEDLMPNISVDHSVDYFPRFSVSDRNRRYYNHATAVAGVAAARDNTSGVRGVAPRATIYSLNLLGSMPTTSGRILISTTAAVSAFTHYRQITAVSNNSWGAADQFHNRDSMIFMAIETGLREGFDGKGLSYVFAAGNKHVVDGIAHGDNANYDAMLSHHGVIVVCATSNRGERSPFSEYGANLWVCAPGSGIRTTERPGNRYGRFSGTSFSAPMVSGVIALMREANSALTWRDVKLILANSARRNDVTDSGWGNGALKYNSFSDRYHFNHQYGFGVVDAQAAVDMASEWVNLPPRESYTETQCGLFSLPSLESSPITSEIPVTSAINFIEHIDFFLTFQNLNVPPFSNPSNQHNLYNIHDLRITLTSPSGTISELAVPATSHLEGRVSGTWRFGTAKHLGEDPSGTWTFQLEDIRNRNSIIGSLGCAIRVYGYKIDLAVAADRVLLESNIEGAELTATLTGAQWNNALQSSHFELKGASSQLSISQVSRISGTEAIVTLAFTGNLTQDTQFQLEAVSGAVSNRSSSLLSDEFQVSANKPTVLKPVTAPQAAVGTNYRFIVTTNTFASLEQPLTFSIGGETVPGLATSGTVISGVPTSSSRYTLTVTATTPDGNSAMTSFVLQVRPRGYPIVVNHIPEQIIVVGRAYTFNLVEHQVFVDSDSENSMLSYTVSGNPDWLQYMTTTGIFSGTPDQRTSSGKITVTITATDSEGNTTKTFLNLRFAMRVRLKVFLEGALQ